MIIVMVLGLVFSSLPLRVCCCEETTHQPKVVKSHSHPKPKVVQSHSHPHSDSDSHPKPKFSNSCSHSDCEASDCHLPSHNHKQCQCNNCLVVSVYKKDLELINPVRNFALDLSKPATSIKLVCFSLDAIVPQPNSWSGRTLCSIPILLGRLLL